uniref:Mannose-6-phosphate isomerase n=1 Tax=Parascaris univalens TaxID=6257 RepID=A0A915AJS0_PARUN
MKGARSEVRRTAVETGAWRCAWTVGGGWCTARRGRRWRLRLEATEACCRCYTDWVVHGLIHGACIQDLHILTRLSLLFILFLIVVFLNS